MCEGDLFGVKPIRQQVTEKITQISETVKREVTDAYHSAQQAGTQGVEKAREMIGDVEIPVFSSAPKAGRKVIDKVKDVVSSNRSFKPEEDPWEDLPSEQTATPSTGQSDDMDEEIDIEALLSKGELLVSEGREQQAMKLFNKVIANDPSNAMAWFNKGVINEMTGQVEDAQKAFKVCLDMDKNHGPAAANLAVLLDRTGNPTEAAAIAHRALCAFPSHPELSRIASQGPAAPTPAPAAASTPEPNLVEEQTVTPEVVAVAQTLEPTPQPAPMAEPTPQPAPMAEPTPQPAPAPMAEPIHEVSAPTPSLDIESLVEDAANLVKQGQPEEALESLREHLHHEAANHPRAWRIAAASMARLALVDSAIEAFTYALDLDNTDAASWYNLGALHRRNGAEDAAITCFGAAIGLKPEYTKAAIGLAEIHSENGNLPAAIDSWRIALGNQPDHPGGIKFAEILIGIAEGEGEVLEMATELPTTIPEGPELAQEALKYIPSNSDRANVTLRAKALTLNGMYPEAVKAWRSMIETSRDDVELWRGMMNTFIAAGDNNTAAKCREKIASLSGELPEIEESEESKPTEIEAAAAVFEPSVEETQPTQIEAAAAVFEPSVQETQPTQIEAAAAVFEPAMAEVSSVEEPPRGEENGGSAIVEPTSKTLSEESDPWGEDPWGDETSITEEISIDEEETEPATEEINRAESVLSTVVEPEPAKVSQPSEEVNLAKAALDAQAISSNSEAQSNGNIESASITNQDIQWYNKGLTLLGDEKYKEALSCFDKALPSFLNDDEMVVRILNARGNSFYYLKEFSDCIDAYHQAMKVQPSAVTGATLYNMGTAYAEVERYADAIKCFEQGMSDKRVNPLTGDHAKMAKEQIRRCKLLLKEQEKKIKRLAKLEK